MSYFSQLAIYSLILGLYLFILGSAIKAHKWWAWYTIIPFFIIIVLAGIYTYSNFLTLRKFPLLFFQGYRCDEKANCSRFRIIKLREPTESKKVVIENKTAIMTFDYGDFTSNSFCSSTYLEEDQISEMFEKRIIKEDGIYISLKGDFVILDGLCVSQILRKGECSIFDKRTNKSVRKIKMEEYMWWCGKPLCGSGGLNFYLLDGTYLYGGPSWVS